MERAEASQPTRRLHRRRPLPLGEHLAQRQRRHGPGEPAEAHGECQRQVRGADVGGGSMAMRLGRR